MQTNSQETYTNVPKDNEKQERVINLSIILLSSLAKAFDNWLIENDFVLQE